MNLRIDELLDQMQTRVLILTLVSVMALTVLGAWIYLFQSPVKEFSNLVATVKKSRIDRDRQRSTDVVHLLDSTRERVELLRSELYGSHASVAPNEMVPFIIGQLDQLSNGLDVQLLGVKPGQVSQVLMFEELAFEVSVSGKYRDIVAWLNLVERDLHPLVVKQFDMVNGNEKGTLLTRLRIVSYRPGSHTG